MTEPCNCGALDCEKCRPGCKTPVECACGHIEQRHAVEDCIWCGDAVCADCDVCTSCFDREQAMKPKENHE